MKISLVLATALLVAPVTTASAAPNSAEDVRIAISVSPNPTAPDKEACRMSVRVMNAGTSTVALSALVQTFDHSRTGLDSWQIPTGMLEPGQKIERTYSCRQPRFIRIDAKNHYGWPKTCVVDGEARTPCPLAVSVNSNLPEPRK